jgi:E3 ubiquitin-protein ligase listerin
VSLANAAYSSIDTVLQQVKAAAGTSLEDIFPGTNVWAQSLEPLLEQHLDSSLSITSNVGGATSLVKRSPTTQSIRFQRDRKGRSVPVRMALYLARLLQQKQDFSTLPERFQIELLFLQCVTIQLVSDQITLMSKNGLWDSLVSAEALSEAEELVSSSRAFVNSSIIREFEEPSLLAQLMDLMMSEAKSLTARGLYSSRALSDLIQATIEANGLNAALEAKLLKNETLKSTPDTVLVAAAITTGLGEASQSSKAMNNFCNRLVSDAAGASPKNEKALLTLVLLTLSSQAYETGELPVANNRIVFAVKQITSWLDEPEGLAASFSAEVCRALSKLLPCMKDVYGSYWEKTVQFCISLWNRAERDPLSEALPYIHASMKLFRALESIPEPNDDLEDALKERSEPKAKGLIKLLQLDRESAPRTQEIVDAMICREVDKISTRLVPDLSDIFPLIASESRDIQTASFSLLHRALPEQQEQQSVDLLLDKKGISFLLLCYLRFYIDGLLTCMNRRASTR